LPYISCVFIDIDFLTFCFACRVDHSPTPQLPRFPTRQLIKLAATPADVMMRKATLTCTCDSLPLCHRAWARKSVGIAEKLESLAHTSRALATSAASLSHSRHARQTPKRVSILPNSPTPSFTRPFNPSDIRLRLEASGLTLELSYSLTLQLPRSTNPSFPEPPTLQLSDSLPRPGIPFP
jgi:hypothetical protein